MTDIVTKLWGFCHTLRHDGIDYGDYIEQLTYLLFLKMADERGIDLSYAEVKNGRGKAIEVDCSWPGLEVKSGSDLTDHYVDVLRALGQQRGLLGDIFAGAISRFANPVSLKKLVGLIDETEWTGLDIDVKAAAFEGLLEKAASEGKKGAGQTRSGAVLSAKNKEALKKAVGQIQGVLDAAEGSGEETGMSYYRLALTPGKEPHGARQASEPEIPEEIGEMMKEIHHTIRS